MSQSAVFTRETEGKKRLHTWINKATWQPMYGIQVHVAPRTWAHLVEGTAPVLFETAREAKAKIEALNAQETRP